MGCPWTGAASEDSVGRLGPGAPRCMAGRRTGRNVSTAGQRLPCEKMDAWPHRTHPDPLRALQRRHRPRAGQAAARGRARGEARAHRARAPAADRARRGAGRALLRRTRTCRTSPQSTGGTVSDSLEMARFGHEHRGQTVVVAGVRFMGETAKILNPEKRVLMPDLAAECSLDLASPGRRVLDVLRRASRPRRGGLRQHQRGGEGARRLDGDLVDRREDRRAPARPGQEDPLGARQAPGRLRAGASPAPTC